MKKMLLKQIAISAYNIGFGAKKHFATFDIVNKIPGVINFFALSIGIFALIIEQSNPKIISASLIIFALASNEISKYDNKNNYSEIGSQEIELFNELKNIYDLVSSKPDTEDFQQYKEKLEEIEKKFYSISISNQILFSDWYAHYKFFWQWSRSIEWIEKELNISLFKDKIPLSLLVTLLAISLIFVGILIKNF